MSDICTGLPGVWNKVKRLGRAFERDGVMWLSHSGSGIEFYCTGSFSMRLLADGVLASQNAETRYARYALYRDGELLTDDRLEEEERLLVAEAEGSHLYRLIKLSESSQSSMGLTGLDAADVRPAQDRAHRFAFLGDSITCGYGVEGDLSQQFTTATENVTLAWAYMTAERENADYRIMSKSGAGLISGYTGDGIRNTGNLISGCYDTCGCNEFPLPDGRYLSELPACDDFEPEAVFINLGTNDMSFCRPVDEEGRPRIDEAEERARRTEFLAEYKSLVEHIRQCSPNAEIVCMFGVLGTKLLGEVETAVSELRAQGDEHLRMIPLEEQSQADGYGTDYHPSRITQKKLSDIVCRFIDSELMIG